MSSCGAPVSHRILLELGEPVARMLSPRFPCRLNLTGIALHALATLTTGGLSTGATKPLKLYTMLTLPVYPCVSPSWSSTLPPTARLPTALVGQEAKLLVPKAP